jgi:peptide/nickel transport system permease protein
VKTTNPQLATARVATPSAPIAPPPAEPIAQASRPAVETLKMFARNPPAIAGVVILALLLLATVFGPMVYDVNPFDMVNIPFLPPGQEAVFGTDYLGRDILAGLLAGGRTTLTVGGVAALITVVIGVLVGSLAGFFGGRVDSALIKLTEFFQVLPPLLFAMVLVSIFEPKLWTIAIAIGVVSWTSVARLTRAEFLRVRELDFVKAARAAGGRTFYLMYSTILPNALPPIVVAAALAIGMAILFEGALSFLGLSDPNTMSWGMIIGQNRNYIMDAWWTVAFAGGAIFLAVLAISLIGDGINDALNPKLRKR